MPEKVCRLNFNVYRQLLSKSFHLLNLLRTTRDGSYTRFPVSFFIRYYIMMLSMIVRNRISAEC